MIRCTPDLAHVVVTHHPRRAESRGLTGMRLIRIK